MVVDLYIENILHRFLDGLDPGIAEFNDLAGVGHNDMVVLPVKVGFFVVRLALAKLVLANKFRFQQKIDRIVQRCSAHTIIFVLHFDIKIFYIKMFSRIIDFLKDRVSFWGFAMAVVLKIFGENRLHRFLIFAVVDRCGCHFTKIYVNN